MLFKTNQEAFNEQLPFLAIAVPDRSVLYDTIHAEYLVEEANNKTIEQLKRNQIDQELPALKT
ncbi:MAG: hypothetical protein LRY32_00565, partial [Flavobacterium sp.]|nr:hypothetical protein [Flavobacterium sp.]